ncbi:MAG TPA: four helix bundle protein [Porphyromonadaceae bacterium]|jgi:four helix bundle protein|nr:four helix bundle protein [Porphyromonadaceae bacterium]HBL34233.1 four helix bundle protein [Porphyromonadaceae bacterium]HBX19976.1 four helix bundle protein [Porphyromonadaceae bacterium]HBX47005.1 four helix bundle protein [Porphyromonadaceae bacterium]HCM22232.1 four helix bundle protein [Porphyromonadaceae bacterium]
MKESIVKNKSFEFSLQIIELYKVLQEHKEFVLSKQLLRSGTSIGANIYEALAGVSKADFANKMAIASKEARETLYWLQLLVQSQMVAYDYNCFISNCEELVRMLTNIVKTTPNSHSTLITNH